MPVRGRGSGTGPRRSGTVPQAARAESANLHAQRPSADPGCSCWSCTDCPNMQVHAQPLSSTSFTKGVTSHLCIDMPMVTIALASCLAPTDPVWSTQDCAQRGLATLASRHTAHAHAGQCSTLTWRPTNGEGFVSTDCAHWACLHTGLQHTAQEPMQCPCRAAWHAHLLTINRDGFVSSQPRITNIGAASILLSSTQHGCPSRAGWQPHLASATGAGIPSNRPRLAHRGAAPALASSRQHK